VNCGMSTGRNGILQAAGVLHGTQRKGTQHRLRGGSLPDTEGRSCSRRTLGRKPSDGRSGEDP
jgi:hypothetical protein